MERVAIVATRSFTFIFFVRFVTTWYAVSLIQFGWNVGCVFIESYIVYFFKTRKSLSLAEEHPAHI